MTYIQKQWQEDLMNETYSPSKTNRASQSGYKCIRRLYYERMSPEGKAPFSYDAKARMREGKQQEKNIRAWMQSNPTWDLERLQEFVEIKDLQLTGHIEGFLIKDNGKPILFEIKTCEKWTFDKVKAEGIDYFLNPSNRWFNGYLNQKTIYMEATEQEKSVFFIKDRSKWDICEVEYFYEPERWNDLETKYRMLNEYVAKEELPPDSACEYSECDSCPFINFCNPDRVIMHEGYKRISDEEEIDMVARYLQLKKEKKEYEKELKDIEQMLKKYEGNEGIFFGDRFEYTGKYIDRRESIIPATRFWNKRIKEL